MQFTSEATPDGVSAKDFRLGAVPGVLWTPTATIQPRPLVLLAHGGGQHSKSPGVAARARFYVTECGYSVAAVDAPGHGDRPRTEDDERFTVRLRALMADGGDIGPLIADNNRRLAAQAVPEWQTTVDALLRRDDIGATTAIGFWGVSLGSTVGMPLVARDQRIVAAVFGLAGNPALARDAARVTVPVQFLMQWDDEFVEREAALALYDAFGSNEKTLHANPGRHTSVPAFEMESSARFFTRHLTPPA